MSVLITFSAYAQDDIKITHAPYLQNLGENEVTVVWTANKPSIGWVELAPDDGTHYYQTERPKFFNAKNGIKLTSTVHSVHLTGLKPGTRYRYRVYSQEVLSHVGWRVIYGNVAATSVYGKQPLTFLTSDHGRQSVNFAMVNDIHGKSDLLEKLAIAPENVAYVGDDLIDWPVMEKVGLSVAVADAHPLLIPRADYVTRIAGGRGAVREVCDLLLLAQGKLDEAKGQSI